MLLDLQIQVAELAASKASTIALGSAFDYNISFALVAVVEYPDRRVAFASAIRKERLAEDPCLTWDDAGMKVVPCCAIAGLGKVLEPSTDCEYAAWRVRHSDWCIAWPSVAHTSSSRWWQGQTLTVSSQAVRDPETGVPS